MLNSTIADNFHDVFHDNPTNTDSLRVFVTVLLVMKALHLRVPVSPLVIVLQAIMVVVVRL